jgi:small subunit ribosomal protein S27
MLGSLRHTRQIMSRQIALRTYLSSAYRCEDSWKARLDTPILQKVNVETLYYELDQNFVQKRKASAIDVDIYANKLVADIELDEVADIVHRLRLTPEASNILDSTSHAIIRNFSDPGHMKALIQLLNNRLSYGIYLDEFTANLLLDKLLEAKDYLGAARIATLVMLQEELDENEITKYLSLYASYKYAQQPGTFDDLVPETPAEVVPEVPKKKSKDEVRIRVKFLRNEYFDDHFDLANSQHLVGKTLLMLAEGLPPAALRNSVELLGYTLYQKFEDGNKFLDAMAGKEVHKEAIETAAKLLADVAESVEAQQQFKSRLDTLQTSVKAITSPLEDEIVQLLKSAIAANEAADIERQQKLHTEWCHLRQSKLQAEFERLQRAQRVQEIERLTKEMASEERKLWFFENEDKIDLDIENKRVFYPKKWFGKKKIPRTIDEGYVPPEVKAQRS